MIFLAAIKEAVAGGAAADAVADQLLLVGQIEPARRRAGRNDQRAGFQPLVIHFEAEGALGKIGFDDRAVQVLGAEMLGLLLDVFHQHGPSMPSGNPGKFSTSVVSESWPPGSCPATTRGFRLARAV
jgi:hypothetical protein